MLGGPLLAFQLFGPLPQRGSPFNVAYFGIDLVNYVVPTAQQQIATNGPRALGFPGGPEEHGGFLGWPLLVVAGGRAGVRRPSRVRVPLAVAAVVGGVRDG